jgi:hypothetical protein
MGFGAQMKNIFEHSSVAAYGNIVYCDLSFCREQFLVLLLSLDKSILKEVGI